jgi:hypothetical protein
MTETTDSRYSRALIRTINQIVAAVLERRALVGLEQAGSAHGWDFFRVAYNGMFSDMLAHCMRALDRNGQSASFWYIYRCQQKAVDEFVIQRGIDWSLIESITDKLKHVRDKTHFHIDRDAVFSSQAVWQTADIKGLQLARCVDSLSAILQFLHARQFGLPFNAPDYDGTDAARIIEAAKKAGII